MWTYIRSFFEQPAGALCRYQHATQGFQARAACTIYDFPHLADTPGGQLKYVPHWVQVFGCYFSVINGRAAARNVRQRLNNQMGVRSVICAQARLGYNEDKPAELRTKTSCNAGSHKLRQSVIDNIKVGTVDELGDYTARPCNVRPIVDPLTPCPP